MAHYEKEKEYYVTITAGEHKGEHAVPTKYRYHEYVKFILLNCKHKKKITWLNKDEIASPKVETKDQVL